MQLTVAVLWDKRLLPCRSYAQEFSELLCCAYPRAIFRATRRAAAVVRSA